MSRSVIFDMLHLLKKESGVCRGITDTACSLRKQEPRQLYLAPKLEWPLTVGLRCELPTVSTLPKGGFPVKGSGAVHLPSYLPPGSPISPLAEIWFGVPSLLRFPAAWWRAFSMPCRS